jgi:hypothetical protein
VTLGALIAPPPLSFGWCIKKPPEFLRFRSQ